MLRKKVTPKSAQIPGNKARGCSVCKSKTHTKLQCPQIEARADRHLGHIPIQIFHNPAPSEHVLTVSGKNKIQTDWPIFAETLQASTKHEVINWGEVIHNEASKNSVEINDEEVKSKRISLHIRLRQQCFDYKRAVKEWSTRISPKQFVIAAGALAFFVLIPFPAVSYYQKLRGDTDHLVEQSVNAFLSLQSSTAAVLNTNLPQAQYDLNAALNSFSQAEAVVEKEHKALVYVASLLPVVGNKVSSRSHILSAGHEVAVGNAYLVKGLTEASVSSTPVMDVVDRLRIFKVHLRGAIPQYENALTELAQVKPESLPVEYQNSFADFRLLFTAVVGDLKNMNSVLGGIETMLGSEQPKRYLVLFQNQHELRPTGGFIGSLAIVDIQRGKITKVDVPQGGSYDFQGQLDIYLKPPLPLQIANARWELQDANWFPDFPASAQKAAWFYEHSRGATVDGVIAVNASVLERLLGIMGPLQNDQYNILLDAENGLETLQAAVESGPDKAKNRPKAVIGAIVHQLLESEIKPAPDQLVPLVTELSSALTQKEIQIYTTDEKAQKQFSDLGWTGEIASVAQNQDYLMVVNTNLGGAKTDAKITDEVEHQAVVQADGTVLDTVIIRRKHNGEADGSLYGGPNSSYLRVYVPRGAELVKANGFIYPEEEKFKVPEKWYANDKDLTGLEVERGFHVESGTRLTEEFGKTVFGNWITTKPGEETEVWLTYKLPFKLSADSQIAKETEFGTTVSRLVGNSTPASRYTLLIQKQSGTNTNFSTQVIYPGNYNPIWWNRDDTELGTNGMRWSGQLKNDELFGVVVRQTNSN